MRALRWCLCGALLMAGWMMVGAASARPDLSRKTGPTLADTGSKAYAFHTLKFDSEDGRRHYRVRVAVPKGAVPQAGFPALYLLDGNAALMELDEAALQRQRDGGHPPVLVFIATDNDLRIDGDARAFDYTPRPLAGAGRDNALGRKNGGADAFLTLIRTRVQPGVAALVKLDATRQTLWGHSYGGLFVLHVLFTQPQAFSRYVAVDASLWWEQGQILGEERGLLKRKALPAPASLLLMTGSGGEAARSGPPGADPKRVQAMQVARGAVSADEPVRMIERLSQLSRLQARLQVLPDLSHGQTLGASLPAAMDFAGAP